MKRLIAGLVCLACIATYGWTEEAKNVITFYPSGGVYGFSSDPQPDDIVLGFAGIIVGYERKLSSWLSIGVAPGITIGGIGSEVVAKPELSLFVDFYPFAGLRRLLFEISLDQLGFILPTPEGQGFFDTFFLGSTAVVGYRFQLAQSLDLALKAGAQLLFDSSISNTDINPTISMGLSVLF